MALYGSSVIQLMDANTGVVTDEARSTNLITNAVSNILSGHFNKSFASGGFFDTYLFNTEDKSFPEVFYGGLLIFNKHLDENVDHILPTTDEIKSFVGCGSQIASDVNNTFRGTLNTSETVIADDYATFVWDFTTEQCNGDIGCLCLTSARGGVVGWGFDGLTNNNYTSFTKLNVSNMWGTTNSISFSSPYNTIGKFTGYSSNEGKCVYIDEGALYYVFRGTASKFDVSKLLDNHSSLRYACNIKDSVKLLDTIQTGVEVYRDVDYISSDLKCGYCKDGDVGSEFKLVKYSGVGLAERITIDMTNINAVHKEYSNANNMNDVPRIVWNDKVYFIDGYYNSKTPDSTRLRVYVLNFDGSFTYKDAEDAIAVCKLLYGGADFYGNFTAKFFEFKGSLFLCSRSNIAVMIDEDGTLFPRGIFAMSAITNNANLFDTSNIWLPEPYVVIPYNNADLYGDALITAYLGTINNQDTVLTKTPDKTMKIIYTLTQK